ncbi:MAG: phosphate acyltransferase PlsX [Chloroflexota bacterium]
MNIALDAMGGDYGPGVIVESAVVAARQYQITISLVGQEEKIRQELDNHNTAGLDIPIVPANDVIGMDDKPATSARSKTDSSIVVASRLVRTGQAQACVSAGSTGAAVAAGILHIGRIKGISRPALITRFPTYTNHCLLLDVGANPDARAENLTQFAIMGSLYANYISGIANPSVRILSNGEEEGKGNELVLEAYELLRTTPGINFQGNIESKDVIGGLADIVVTDGFTGNVFVKTAEATGSLVQKVLKQEFMRGPISMLGGLLATAGIRRVRGRLGDGQFGGAILLGLSGPVVVAHGRSDVEMMLNCIRIAKQAVETNLSEEIRQGVALAKTKSTLKMAEPSSTNRQPKSAHAEAVPA